MIRLLLSEQSDLCPRCLLPHVCYDIYSNHGKITPEGINLYQFNKFIQGSFSKKRQITLQGAK